jgi:tRNA-uridine 2-sulfurtransferase
LETVLVGMSGGVDSTVAAFLLKQAGYNVKGAMLRMWKATNPDEDWYRKQGLLVAEAAAAIGIGFDVIDARKEFQQRVVTYFVEGYASGITPNPCFYCNRALKFDVLQEYANKEGIQWISSGHYARVLHIDNRVRLLRGIDPQKDQAYMLASLEKPQLRRLLLPMGSLTKDETRQIARQQGFTAVDTEESQDVCFLPEGDYASFLREYRQQVVQPGDIVNQEGEGVGQHQGLAFYTIGQRKGLGIYAPEPTYVIAKDISNNRLIVGNQAALGNDSFQVSQVNWIAVNEDQLPFECDVEIRYHARPIRGRLSHVASGKVLVQLQEQARDITPGQAAVFYEGDEVLGSGIFDL